MWHQLEHLDQTNLFKTLIIGYLYTGHRPFSKSAILLFSTRVSFERFEFYRTGIREAISYNFRGHSRMFLISYPIGIMLG